MNEFLNEEEFLNFSIETLKNAKSELPTVQIQLISLLRFVKALGYQPQNPNKPISFVLVDKDKNYPHNLSLIDAIHLHNYGFFLKRYPKYIIPKQFHFYAATEVEFLNEACDQKVVEDVFLQFKKKEKEWTATKHYVKFANQYRTNGDNTNEKII